MSEMSVSVKRNKKRSKKRSKKRDFIAVVLIFLGVAGLFVAGWIGLMIYTLSGLGDMFDSPMCDPQNPSGIQEVARIELPPSYSNLKSTCGGVQGWWAQANFDMAPSDLDLFLASTNIESLQPTTELSESLEGNYEEIGYVTSYLYGSDNRDEWYEEVVINTGNPKRWTVYFLLLGG